MSITIIIIICVIVLGALKGFKPTKHRSYRKNNPYTPYKRFNPDNQTNYANNNNYDLSRYEDQLKAVSSSEAKFTAQRLMKVGEFKVFQVIESQIMPSFKGCRLFAQVCLGEILNADETVRRCINSKRLDILIINPFGMPLVAVEYQGSGHYQGTAALRDAVKKEALRKAGIKYIEIMESHTEQDIQYVVTRALEDALGQKAKTKLNTVSNAFVPNKDTSA